MAAYFRRRAGTCGVAGGPLSDDPYPALMVAASATAGGGAEGVVSDLGPSSSSAVEKVYEFQPEPRDDDVIDCCPRHYQRALVDAAQLAPPSLETFRPGGDASSAATGLGECCPLVNAQRLYGGAASTSALW